ncbi:MAG: FormyltransN domain-containing protein [Nitrospira sp.]|nr:MAG: FormyltransN domain-containing protein [Nitrospira sp.]
MRVLVLTTDTLHHSYFVRELVSQAPKVQVILETTGVRPSFEVAHPFEAVRDQYERDLWFDGKERSVSDFAEAMTYTNVNDSEAVETAKQFLPDITVAFGIRKAEPALIRAAGPRVVNLHGGDPEFYRGLDSHLWAIYHNDFKNVVTTLHVLNEALDDGPLIGIRPVALHRDMRLHQLRHRNTEAALNLTRVALEELQSTGQIASRSQRQVGRYYSFMPTVLKDVCVKRFEKHCARLE